MLWPTERAGEAAPPRERGKWGCCWAVVQPGPEAQHRLWLVGEEPPRSRALHPERAGLGPTSGKCGWPSGSPAGRELACLGCGGLSGDSEPCTSCTSSALNAAFKRRTVLWQRAGVLLPGQTFLYLLFRFCSLLLH